MIPPMSHSNELPLEQTWHAWHDCLKGKDINSIFQQIYRMVWDAAIFRLVLENRKAILEEQPQNPPLNPYFHMFLDRCFFQAQAVSIRRLADKSKYGLRGKKGIYSLYSLIDDMKSRRLELTRTKFFQLRNLPYDYSGLREKERAYITEQFSKTSRGVWIPKEYDWGPAAEAHVTFDRVCGKNQQERSPNDIIDEKIFTRLIDRLDTCQIVISYVDKFIAHSATPESRSIESTEGVKVTLKHLWDAHQTLYEIAEYLSVTLYSESNVPLAIEPISLFDHWAVPALDGCDTARLSKAYNEYQKESDRWRLEGVEHLWEWIEV